MQRLVPRLASFTHISATIVRNVLIGGGVADSSQMFTSRQQSAPFAGARVSHVTAYFHRTRSPRSVDMLQPQARSQLSCNTVPLALPTIPPFLFPFPSPPLPCPSLFLFLFVAFFLFCSCLCSCLIIVYYCFGFVLFWSCSQARRQLARNNAPFALPATPCMIA